MSYGTTIYRRIEELCKKREITISQLSKISGVSYTVFYNLKNQRSNDIAFSTLLRLCSALRITPNEFLSADYLKDPEQFSPPIKPKRRKKQ